MGSDTVRGRNGAMENGGRDAARRWMRRARGLAAQAKIDSGVTPLAGAQTRSMRRAQLS